MSLRDQHVEALLDETVAEYEPLLPAPMLAVLRGVFTTRFDVHPVMRELIDEHAPREQTDESGAQPAIDADGDAADGNAIRRRYRSPGGAQPTRRLVALCTMEDATVADAARDVGLDYHPARYRFIKAMAALGRKLGAKPSAAAPG